MDNILAPCARSFLQHVQEHLPDARDRRGRRHSLVFIIAATVIAVMQGSQSLSSIHRFMCNHLEWLRTITGVAVSKCVSRSQLPLVLKSIRWDRLEASVRQCFGSCGPHDWLALDGKALRGSPAGAQRQAVVLAVTHGSAREVARMPQQGEKSSEIVVVRQLLSSAGLASCHLTTDAMHTNPETLSQVAAAGGHYLAQIKGNQPDLLALAAARAAQEPPLARHTQVEKGHGRVVQRTSTLFALRPRDLQKRWRTAQPAYMVQMYREVYNSKTQEVVRETSYHMTNLKTGAPGHKALLQTLHSAIQGHWAVESNNWVRDATLGEDHVKVSNANQAQVLAVLRSAALAVLRPANIGKNLRALMDRFRSVPAELEAALRRYHFL